MAPLDAQIALSDKYRVSKGAALMTGMQALVRLVLEQSDSDRDAGLNTGGYVTGYRGSPIGAFDIELARVREDLDQRNIVFNPAINEDLAATAVNGTQGLAHFDDPEVEGVFAVWYGKGPGVDRSIDAIKHANLAGAAAKGGMLFLMGDDPSSKSSTVAHQSEQAMISAQLPILYPASLHDYVPLGLHGFAMSRHSGLAVAMKIVTDTADSSATVALDRLRPDIVPPPGSGQSPDLNNSPGFMPFIAQEQRQFARLDAALDYARANKLNREVISPARKRLGLIAVGKAHVDAMAALSRLGLSPAQAAENGIGLFRMSLVWPLEPEGLSAFCDGYDEVLVIEEKKALVETELARLLVNWRDRPVLSGKRDGAGAPLLPEYGELSPEIVAAAIARAAGLTPCAETGASGAPRQIGNAPSVDRMPYFCAGCPHNRSTRVPEGSAAGAGIGCHAMAIWINPDSTQYFTQMGGEGMSWAGRAPFSSRKHMFQNLGDGTYVHSGMLAIRAAIAANINITYKILCNDAVAMTGGQPLEGQPLPAEIGAQVLALGVKRVAVVSDQPEAAKALGEWPTRHVSFHSRTDLDAVQRDLREEPGTTVLLYVQTCAAEKRRRRKRGKFPDPPKRVVINPAVCEGCGDCGLVSNCVAIKPLDTAFGVKRRIDQTACNKDYSCLEGFCPSFVTVHGEAGDPLAAKAGVLHAPPDDPLPDPDLAPAEDFAAVITGIGGTGVVTVAAVLAMAARLEGLHALTLDQTGLSQKNGAVSSHLQIGRAPLDDRPSKIAPGTARTLIACDMLTGASDAALRLIDPDRGRAVANGEVEPLPIFARDPSARPDGEQLAARLSAWLDPERVKVADAARLARALVGDGMGANLMLVGVASQCGALPVPPAAIERAIRLNGAAIDMNLAAFAWGRWIAIDPARAETAAQSRPAAVADAQDYDALIARFEAHLTAYQNAACARRFRAALAPVEAAEAALAPGRRELSRLAARSLVKALAIKDEYEVARLHTAPEFRDMLARDFAPGAKLRFHLAPPILGRRDPVTGLPRKTEFGPWILPLFRVLARMKALRGGPLDIFGRSAERREERAHAQEVEALCALAARRLGPQTDALCAELLALPLEIRGFGHVRARNAERIAPRIAALRAKLEAAAAP